MSSPPPPNPLTATTADFLNSVARKNSHPAIYQTFYSPQPARTVAFPPSIRRQQLLQHSGSSSHHQQPSSNQNVAVGMIPGSRGYPPRPVSGYPQAIDRSYGFLNSDILGQTSYPLVNPSSAHLQQTLMGGGAVVATGATRVSVAANPKVVGQSSVAAKSGDDAFVLIGDRKVQVSEGTSLYAQCRSWLKNGLTLENQPQHMDCVKSLPKPLPASMVEARKEDEMDIEKTPDVDRLSAKELLQQHIKHAKKVRARLKNQRLRRIERYKDRLALLLPPVVDQRVKPDPPS